MSTHNPQKNPVHKPSLCPLIKPNAEATTIIRFGVIDANAKEGKTAFCSKRHIKIIDATI